MNSTLAPLPPLFGISGRSGQDKTTLIEALLPWFAARGLVVNVHQA